MVHGDDFRHHRNVLSGIQEYGDLWQIDVENGRRFHVDADAFDDSVLIPFLELYDYLDALLLADSAYTKYRLDVDEADTANFHVMTLHLVTAPDQDIVASLAGDYQIVSDEAVAALHEIEHTLGLADAAFTGEKKADTEDVGQRSMKRNGRSEFHLQHGLDAAIEFRRFELGADERDPGGGGRFL